MNPYEQRQQLRAERLRARSTKLAAEADALHATNHTLLGIMNGSPILVGHHSEKRHRRDLDKMDARLHKAVELTNEAASCARRADAAESNETISSDDPDAIGKLRVKLAELESKRAKAVEANALIRKAQKIDKGKNWLPFAWELLQAVGWNLANAQTLTRGDVHGDIGVPGYRLRNWASECKRLAGRIAELEKRATDAPVAPVTVGAYSIVEEDNRLRVRFPGKPDAETRMALRRAGFLWAPSVGAWQRRPSQQARVFAEALVERLAGVVKESA